MTNKTFQTTVAGILVAVRLLTGNASAESASAQSITEPTYKIWVNDAPLDAPIYENGEHIMLPLRAICEAMGYSVDYDHETAMISLSRGAHYITMHPTEDAYTFSKMAPVSLGIAPQLIGGRTYVPIRFVSEILPSADCSMEPNGEIRITDPKQAGTHFQAVVALDGIKDGLLSVMDEILGEVTVSITEETIFQGIAPADIQKDTAFMIEYRDHAVSASLPAQATASNIMSTAQYEERFGEKEAAPVAYRGSVTEVGEDYVILQTENGRLRLILSDETLIRHHKNKRRYQLWDIKPGMKISGTHHAAVTFSLPPQSTACEIIIDEP